MLPATIKDRAWLQSRFMTDYVLTDNSKNGNDQKWSHWFFVQVYNFVPSTHYSLLKRHDNWVLWRAGIKKGESNTRWFAVEPVVRNNNNDNTGSFVGIENKIYSFINKTSLALRNLVTYFLWGASMEIGNGWVFYFCNHQVNKPM